MKDKYEFESPLDPELWEAWLKAAADPEQRLVEWIRKGVPLGMSKEIPCCGIFPKADDPTQEVEEAPELADQLGIANYRSFTDEPEHARTELGRMVEEGFAVVLPTAKANAMHEYGAVSKLALLSKEKDDGSVKRRSSSIGGGQRQVQGPGAHRPAEGGGCRRQLPVSLEDEGPHANQSQR